jgi:phenylacetate-CoA ligase
LFAWYFQIFSPCIREEKGSTFMTLSQLANAARELIEAHQLARLQLGFQRVLPFNAFYAQRYAPILDTLSLESLAGLKRLPLITKYELAADQEIYQPFGRNLTYPLSNYIRLHETSGTTGRPLKVFDTQESWDWWADCWLAVYEGAGVTRDDIIYLAAQFGPMIGFWSAYEGARRLGALTMAGGGLNSLQRLLAMKDVGATVLICTPGYALHLAEVAQERGFDLGSIPMRITIHSGEPGASVPATRQRIEEVWHARTYDHAGLTEVGAYGFSCSEQAGIHINESEFIPEIVNCSTGGPAQPGEIGELVLTNLGRWGYPALRYRTGDLVRHGGYTCPCGRGFLFLPGGVLGRTDDMLIVRGVNIYPSTLENILRRFVEVREYRVIVTQAGTLDEMQLQVECPAELLLNIQEALHTTLGLRVPVEAVEAGSLPRFEGKTQRIEDRRPQHDFQVH